MKCETELKAASVSNVSYEKVDSNTLEKTPKKNII